jgi:hypothetical protein
VSHPAYSPDIAFSRFYPSDTVKQCLQNCDSSPFNNLSGNIGAILNSIGASTFDAAMRAWMIRFQRVPNLGGKYASFPSSGDVL